MSGLLRVTEATFGRQVLRAPLPVLVCWGTRGCPARQALRPALERIATAYAGRMRVATMLLDAAPLLAELYGVTASPTLMVFQHGERQGQAIGFLPDGLVDLLAAAVAQGAVAGDIHWSPVEAQLEEVVLIPLLARWGYTVQRQVGCVLAGRGTPQRGRIDLLVYADPATPPLTLIESKRAIRSNHDLQLAVRQAVGYAHALDLATFLIAAPQGLWCYQRDGLRVTTIQHITSLAIHAAPDQLRDLLLSTRRLLGRP
jgi:thioredoxin 1